MTLFKGWPADALEFFEGLEADNSKTYWQEHKATYETKVRAPMDALLTELAEEFGAGKVFRPYRDVRFSKDKSPYKTNIAATVENGGYITLSAEGLGAGCGYYMMSTGQLARYRAAVDDEASGTELERLIGAVRKKGIEVTGHDELKTAPKGYPKDHPRIGLLKYKGLITWRSWPPAAWLGTAKAKDRIVTFFHDSRPVVDWLDTYVGPA